MSVLRQLPADIQQEVTCQLKRQSSNKRKRDESGDQPGCSHWVKGGSNSAGSLRSIDDEVKPKFVSTERCDDMV